MKVPSFQPKNNLLKDKRILITGAGSGIGRQVSLDAAKMGDDLILLSKKVTNLSFLEQLPKGKIILDLTGSNSKINNVEGIFW